MRFRILHIVIETKEMEGRDFLVFALGVRGNKTINILGIARVKGSNSMWRVEWRCPDPVQQQEFFPVDNLKIK